MDNSFIKEGFLGQKMIVLPEVVKEGLWANPITRPFAITDIGYYPNAFHHHRIRKLGVQEHIFIYCTEGSGTFKIDNRLQKILPNHFFIIPKNTKHEYWANEDNPWSIYWIHFDGNMARSLYERYLSNSKNNRIIPFDNDRVALFDKVFKIFKSDYVNTGMEYANILGLNFISSFIYYGIVDDVGIHAPNNLVEEIIDFLSENLDKSLRAEEISNKFNYSTSYLFNLFKKRTGYSLMHFFNLKKMQKACEYLNYTDLSVKEISYHMGFQDPLYFSRQFKKHMGLSPNGYKKAQHS